MSKMSVAWYKDCLRNMKYYLFQKEQNLQNLQDECERTRQAIAELTKQIEHAEQKGMTEFDATRLLKPRNKKSNA